MSNYIKATDFAGKDALLSGDPNKIIKGTEINDEFANIQTALNSKADVISPSFGGTPLAPTAAANTNTTQIATTAYVYAERANTATLTNKTLSSPVINTPTISGGSLSGITDLAIADGGTGASTAADARTNLGLVIGTDVAPVASPAFTGTPTAPTAATGTNTTQLATTAHVYATGALKADKSTTVSAGTGLSGGGDLSANRTLAIANTGVTASTYGSASAIPVLAINAQGQVTSASTVAAAAPVVLVEGEYATNTTHSVAVNTTRPILITLSYSGGQGGNTYIYGRFQWGLGGLTSSRVFANAAVNYQVHVSDTQMVTLTPSGSTTIQFRVDTTNLDGTYGAPSTMRVTAVQL